MGNSDSQTGSLLNVHVLGIVLSLQISPLGWFVLDDVLQHTLGATTLLLAALSALGAEGVGKDA